MMAFIQKNKKAILLTTLVILNLCVAAWGDDAASVGMAGNK